MVSGYKDDLYRAIRTFFQAFISTLALLAIPMLGNIQAAAAGNGEVIYDLNAAGNILVAAVAAGFIALITYAWNLTETITGVSVLKPPVRDEPNA